MVVRIWALSHCFSLGMVTESGGRAVLYCVAFALTSDARFVSGENRRVGVCVCRALTPPGYGSICIPRAAQAPSTTAYGSGFLHASTLLACET